MINLLFKSVSIIFLLGWTLWVMGLILWMLERRLVRQGSSKAATWGPLLAREWAWVSDGDTVHQKRIELEQARARWTSADTLLFAPAGNYRLDWFGRAHRTGNEFVLEARLSLGQILNLAGLLVAFVAAAIVCALAGWYLATAGIFVLILSFVRRYWRSYRDQKDLGRRILQEVRAKLQRAV